VEPGKSAGIAKQEDNMKTQTTYTRATALGPFLTLILLSSSERGRAIREDLRRLSDESPSSVRSPSAASNESCGATTLISLSPDRSGPFLTLILNSGRSQPQVSGG
jgi:hypothetical protein